MTAGLDPKAGFPELGEELARGLLRCGHELVLLKLPSTRYAPACWACRLRAAVPCSAAPVATVAAGSSPSLLPEFSVAQVLQPTPAAPAAALVPASAAGAGAGAGPGRFDVLQDEEAQGEGVEGVVGEQEEEEEEGEGDVGEGIGDDASAAAHTAAAAAAAEAAAALTAVMQRPMVADALRFWLGIVRARQDGSLSQEVQLRLQACRVFAARGVFRSPAPGCCSTAVKPVASGGSTEAAGGTAVSKQQYLTRFLKACGLQVGASDDYSTVVCVLCVRMPAGTCWLGPGRAVAGQGLPSGGCMQALL